MPAPVRLELWPKSRVLSEPQPVNMPAVPAASVTPPMSQALRSTLVRPVQPLKSSEKSLTLLVSQLVTA